MKEKQLLHQDLMSLVSNKLAAFEDFYAATLLLAKTFKDNDVAEIEAIVNLRDSQIAVIQQLDRDIQRKASWQQLQTGIENKNINALLVKLEEVIKMTQNINVSCFESAVTLFKQNGDDLRLLNKEINLFHGYGEKKASGSRFLDIKT